LLVSAQHFLIYANQVAEELDGACGDTAEFDDSRYSQVFSSPG